MRLEGQVTVEGPAVLGSKVVCRGTERGQFQEQLIMEQKMPE